MKVDVVGRGGRKKDFWDLHELLSNFMKFENADADFDPVCLRGKYWEIIKLDILDALKSIG